MLGSCDMMKEDEDLTNCGLFVNFKYDYNLQRSDMFADHVGGVTLYVFDSDGRFVRSYEQRDIATMGRMVDGKYVHTMQILDLPDGDYRLMALAQQRPYDETLTRPGAKYRRSPLAAGDDNEGFTVELDRTDSPAGTPLMVRGAIPATREAATASTRYVSAVAPLDTLWHGMSGATPIAYKGDGHTVTTISLTRDTKMLTIGLHNLDEGKQLDIAASDFDIFIVDNNGKLAYNNNLLPDDNLVYTPFRTWDTQSLDAQGHPVDATAHACLTFNRLVWHELPDENALLIIRNRTTGKEVAAINLTDFLSQGRNAYDQFAYSRQEYLDRSYDYYMDFFIRNDIWQYAEVRINVLSWAKRIQNVTLK